MLPFLATSFIALQDSAATSEEAAAAAEEGAVAADQGEPTANDGFVALFETLGPIFEDTVWWGWGVLFLAILGGLVIGKIAQAMLRGASDRLIARGWEFRGLIFRDIASPASLAIFAFGLFVGLTFIALGGLAPVANKIVQFLYIIAIGWFLYNLVDLVDLGLRRVTGTNKLATQLVPLIRKALRIFIVIVFTLFIAQNVFEVNITAWLAGLGIAGLAVSLAGQDSIKNLFGSITILLDKPFALGDRVKFADVEGFVEEIGFRSTKVRTFMGHLITIPNMKFIDGTVENITARPFIRRSMNVTITYDTPPEKVHEAVRIVKDLLAAPDIAEAFNVEDRPPRVFFNEFNSDSLNIMVSYWYFLDEAAGRDWWAYLAHSELFNHRLLAAYNDAGVDFAFPTQTLHLAGDPNRRFEVHVKTESN